MAAFNKFNQFVADLANKVHNLGSDSLKIYLSNTAPVATNAIKTDVAEITQQNGYAAPMAVTVTGSTQSSGTYKLVANDPAIVTATGAVGPFRYAILYNDTPTSPVDPLIGWWDYGSSISLATGDTFTVDLDQVAGILQLA